MGPSMSDDEFNAINFLLTLLDGALELQNDQALIAISKPVPAPPSDLTSRVVSSLAEDELLETLSLFDLSCEAALASEDDVVLLGQVQAPPSDLLSILRKAIVVGIGDAALANSPSEAASVGASTRTAYMIDKEPLKGRYANADRFVDDTLLDTFRTAAMWAYVHAIDIGKMAELLCATYASVLAAGGTAAAGNLSERRPMLRRELVRSFLEECEKKRKRSSPLDDVRISEKRHREMGGVDPRSRDLLEEICSLAPIERDIVLLDSDSFTAEEISGLLRIELHEVVMRRNRAHTRLSKRLRSAIAEGSLI